MLGISYWALPLISGCVWLGTLIAMLVVWNVEGRPHYASMDPTQTIAYISDVGAEGLKPLFIAGCVVTTVFLDFSFAAERWLRHRGRLVKNTTTSEKILSGLSIAFALIGTAGLILLSIFDTLRHPRLHDVFLLLFIAGYVISAIFICWEYQRLGIRYRQHRVLRISFWVKLVFILVEVALAIAFVVCNFRKVTNAAAVLEWAVAFIFTFYVLSFVIDLLPAVHTKILADREKALGMEHSGVPSDDYSNGTMNGQNGNNLPNGHVANRVHYPNGPQTYTANDF